MWRLTLFLLIRGVLSELLGETRDADMRMTKRVDMRCRYEDTGMSH